MGSFSSFLKDAGDFLEEVAVPIALGVGGGLLLSQIGGQKTPTVPTPIASFGGGAGFGGVSPMMIGIIVAAVLALVLVLAL